MSSLCWVHFSSWWVSNSYLWSSLVFTSCSIIIRLQYFTTYTLQILQIKLSTISKYIFIYTLRSHITSTCSTIISLGQSCLLSFSIWHSGAVSPCWILRINTPSSTINSHGWNTWQIIITQLAFINNRLSCFSISSFIFPC